MTVITSAVYISSTAIVEFNGNYAEKLGGAI